MEDAPRPPAQSAPRALLWRIGHSPAIGAAAMMMFLVLAALWLAAALTAQVWYHSAPPGYVFSSLSTFYVWVAAGIAGAVLTLGSLAQRLWRLKQRPVSLVLTACLAVPAELGVVLLVTHHAIVTAPYGVDSGEGVVAIAILVVAQLLLLGAVAASLARFARLDDERALGSRGRLQWSGLLGTVGMVITCAAFAVWSLHDGTTLLVSTGLIAGEQTVSNVGAWWPGLFAAMAALTVMTVIRAPGARRARHGVEPLVPPARGGALIRTGDQ